MPSCKILAAVLSALLATLAAPSPGTAAEHLPDPILGRWDGSILTSRGPRACWLEFTEDARGLRATVVCVAGMPASIPNVSRTGNHVEFIIPGSGKFSADGDGTFLTGVVEAPVPRARRLFADPRDFFANAGTPMDSLGHSSWRAVRAPDLPTRAVSPAAPETLFDGRTLTGWKASPGGGSGGWVAREGALVNESPVADLVSLGQYRDFVLHIEYRTEPGEDSGIHLRGRYEIQVLDTRDPRVPGARLETSGAVYGFLPPLANPQRPAGEWNTLDVTLVGRQVSATLNDVVIHDHETIAGVTGDALDADEGQPGPLVLQGHLGRVAYRNIVVTPLR